MSVLTTPALLLDPDLSLSVGTREISQPDRDEALVRVRWAGLCGSDLHVMRTGDWVQQWPATLGHEIYGTVEVAPADGSLAEGDPVVADSRIPCGECPPCLERDGNRCENVRFVGEACPGGFAGHCVLPSRLLHRLPAGFDSVSAVLSEPLAVVLHGVSLLRSEPHRILILGHGPIGALIHIELRRRFPNAEVHVAEPAALRAQLARALGAGTVPSAADLSGAQFDTVIDAAGYGGSLRGALARVRARGQLLILALSRHPVELEPADLVERGLCLVGASAFVDELPQAITLLATEAWRYEPVITEAVSLGELPEVARRQLERPDAVKVVVSP